MQAQRERRSRTTRPLPPLPLPFRRNRRETLQVFLRILAGSRDRLEPEAELGFGGSETSSIAAAAGRCRSHRSFRQDRTPRSDSPETPRPEVTRASGHTSLFVASVPCASLQVPTRDVAPAKTVNPVTVFVGSIGSVASHRHGVGGLSPIRLKCEVCEVIERQAVIGAAANTHWAQSFFVFCGVVPVLLSETCA